MRRSQARGYLLEIVLAKLIEVNGYDVILQANGSDIKKMSNGLNVKGRGGYHQFDSLGEFRVAPPFMYPLRLFIEAKFNGGRNSKVKSDKVRMGIGVLQDVNSNYSTVTINSEELALTKYDYHYALFSTSGFSIEAQKLALAHKISLIDLGVELLYDLEVAIDKIVVLFDRITSRGRNNISIPDFNSFKDYFRDIINARDVDSDKFCEFKEQIDELLEKLRNHSIYLAGMRSSKIIALIPDNDQAFRDSLTHNPHQAVSITWSDCDRYWIVMPEDNSFRLTFILPEIFVEELKDDLQNLEEKNMDMKDSSFAKMSFIAYLDGENPTLCTLKFSRETTLNHIRRCESQIIEE